jgi:cysteine synthase B
MAGIIDLIGNTPMVELAKLNPNPKVRIFAKLEGNNPGGSVKDRASLNMIRSALERGQIQKGTKLVEATSGNTGIALAMIAGLYGLKIELVMPSNSTRERTLTMEAFGAKVTLLDNIEACRDYAEEKGVKPGYFLLNQFANSDNYMSHYKTTGPEIWRDTDGQITHFVSSMGTTGTIMGCSRFFKEKEPAIQIIGCQPTEESSIPGIRRWPAAYLPKIFEEEGVFAGMSSGGACSAALKVASELEEGTIVFIACDRGDRYLSSPLFG